MEKLVLSPEEEAKKEVWLKELANFIVEANKNTWAADAPEVEPQRPGYKELNYKRGDWELRDSYTGYFRAPGMTTIYFKGGPAWTIAYGGTGMTPSKYEVTKPTFQFLKAALMRVTKELPYRGPKEYREGNRKYELEVHGDLADFDGNEKIFENDNLLFTQLFFGGIVINRDANKQPEYPWNR